jgi:hypothetical protein
LKCNIFSIYNKINLGLNSKIMAKDRSIEILEHKIAELEQKIANFEKYNIDDKKTENLRILKLKYETQLEEILAQA